MSAEIGGYGSGGGAAATIFPRSTLYRTGYSKTLTPQLYADREPNQPASTISSGHKTLLVDNFDDLIDNFDQCCGSGFVLFWSAGSGSGSR